MDSTAKVNGLKGFSGWKFWAGILVSGIFVSFALYQVEIHKVWRVIISTDPLLFGFVILIGLFQYVIRTWRWEVILKPIKETTFIHRLAAILVGFAANCILPARLGEFIRANVMGQAEGMSSSSAFGTVVVERLFDSLTLLLVLLIGVLGTTFPPEWSHVSGSLRATGYILLLVYLVAIVFLAGLKYRAKAFLNLLDRILFLIPENFRSRILKVVWNFSLGLVLAKNARGLFLAIFYSFLLWFLSLCQIKLVSQGIGLTLPLIAPFLIMTMETFSVMIPSAPGFIGTFHVSVQYGFLFYGVGKEEALSAAILLHAAWFFPTILLGLASFIFFKISFSNRAKKPTIGE